MKILWVILLAVLIAGCNNALEPDAPYTPVDPSKLDFKFTTSGVWSDDYLLEVSRDGSVHAERVRPTESMSIDTVLSTEQREHFASLFPWFSGYESKYKSLLVDVNWYYVTYMYEDVSKTVHVEALTDDIPQSLGVLIRTLFDYTIQLLHPTAGQQPGQSLSSDLRVPAGFPEVPVCRS